jgi:hypothetical protein
VLANWLISPSFSFFNYAELSFWTRTETASVFNDRLRVLYSPSGAATIASFTQVLLDINPTEAASGFPDVWTNFNLQVSGPGGGTGRIAFVYTSANVDTANYIGIDTVTVRATPVPSTATMVSLALLGLWGLNRRRRAAVQATA